MSFFTFHRVAEGYAHSRPAYHPIIMKKIREHVNLHGKFNDALDIGCGTGLSTVALKEIADQVTGTDDSHEMITAIPARKILCSLYRGKSTKIFTKDQFQDASYTGTLTPSGNCCDKSCTILSMSTLLNSWTLDNRCKIYSVLY